MEWCISQRGELLCNLEEGHAGDHWDGATCWDDATTGDDLMERLKNSFRRA